MDQLPEVDKVSGEQIEDIKKVDRDRCDVIEFQDRVIFSKKKAPIQVQFLPALFPDRSSHRSKRVDSKKRAWKIERE